MVPIHLNKGQIQALEGSIEEYNFRLNDPGRAKCYCPCCDYSRSDCSDCPIAIAMEVDDFRHDGEDPSQYCVYDLWYDYYTASRVYGEGNSITITACRAVRDKLVEIANRARLIE